MRTTININDALLEEVRHRAASSGRSFRETLNEILAAGLANLPQSEIPAKFRVKPHDLQLKAGFRQQSFNQLFDQLEAEDLAQ